MILNLGEWLWDLFLFNRPIALKTKERKWRDREAGEGGGVKEGGRWKIYFDLSVFVSVYLFSLSSSPYPFYPII